MSGEQSRESAVAIGRLDERVAGMQQQIDRRFEDMADDMGDLKDEMKWLRRTAIGLIVSLLIVAASIIVTAAGA